MEEKRHKITIRIKSIDLVSFKTEDYSDELDPSIVGFNVSYNISSDIPNSTSVVEVTITIVASKIELGQISTKATFGIKCDPPTPDKTEYPFEVLATILGATISTTRGMLVTLSKGAKFERAYLPIIDAAALIRNAIKSEPSLND